MDKDHLVIQLPDNNWGRRAAADLAYNGRMPCVTNVYDVKVDGDAVEFKKALYNGHIEGSYCVKPPIVITVKPPAAQKNIMLVCGNGFNSTQKIQRLLELADRLGVAVGASRPCVTSGLMPPGALLGLSGQTVSPKLCVVLGASGAQAFMAGIDKSEKIIAVNKDEHAMIFEQCDLGICCDCFELLDCLEAVMVCESTKCR